jgi:hypothetical protein
VNKMETTVEGFLKAYVDGKLGKQRVCGRWSMYEWGNMEVLQYTPSDVHDEHEIVAYKMQDGTVLSNANRLIYVGRKFAWGHEVSRWGRDQVHEQRLLETWGAIPLPFTLFNEVPEMDVRDFSWVVKPKAETVISMEVPRWQGDHPQRRTRHFSGACVFAIGKDTYLFDIDRQEIQEHNIFNPFLTKLPKRVSSIEEAYDVLIPDEVRKARAEGIEVKRQGEFFFIKYSDDCPIRPDLTDEEWKILRYPPSRIGYGIAPVGRFNYVNDDRAPFEKPEEIDTPVKKEFQEAALKFKDVFDRYRGATSKAGTLGKSATGSHSVEHYVEVDGKVFASGKITQNRRQHGDLILQNWYEVVANTGTLSWTVTGDID